jgi:hypothetical protein
MRSFAILLLKEEAALFSSPIAYAVMTVFLLIMGYSFTLTLFISHQPSMVHVFFQMFVLFMLTAPLITMRLLAEERKLRTLEVLLTSPVSEVAIVLAKFVASMSLVVVMLLLSGCYAAALAYFGDPDFGPIYSGYRWHRASGVGAHRQSSDRGADLAQRVPTVVDHRQFRLAIAKPGGHAGGKSVACGAFSLLCGGVDLPFGRRLLS